MRKSEIYNEVLKEYEQTRQSNQRIQQEREAEIYEKIPEIKELEKEIRSLGIKSAKKIIKGEDVNISQQLDDLHMAKKAHLVKNDYPEDYLELEYNCKFCKDTGYIDNRKCNCLYQKLADGYYKMSNLDSVLSKENFSTFNEELFSDEPYKNEDLTPRENILRIKSAAMEFIQNFNSDNTYNLLFFGSTGTGKTFMLNCIAKELMDLGHTVVYQSAHNLSQVIADYKFSKTDDILAAKEKYDMLLDSDLLIIDDLGTESTNSFTNAEIFNILNTRNLRNKKILISANLSPGEISKQYSDRFFSRIMDRFNMYRFYGEDLRWM